MSELVRPKECLPGADGLGALCLGNVIEGTTGTKLRGSIAAYACSPVDESRGLEGGSFCSATLKCKLDCGAEIKMALNEIAQFDEQRQQS